MDAVIRFYDAAGNMIEMDRANGEFQKSGKFPFAFVGLWLNLRVVARCSAQKLREVLTEFAAKK